jgi:DNA-binding response OmpR family regulator
LHPHHGCIGDLEHSGIELILRGRVRDPLAPVVIGERSKCGGCVLVVDDEPLVQRVITRALRADGFVVLVANDACEAIALSEAHDGAIDLVLDVTLPSMNGIELAGRLSLQRPSTRVLFVTGLDGDGAAEAAKHGPVLGKPFNPKELVAMLRELFSTSTTPSSISRNSKPPRADPFS